MEALIAFAQMFAASAVSSLFSATWEGAVLAACVVLCLRFFPRMSAGARSLIWMNVFMLLLLLPIAPLIGIHGGGGVPNQSAPLQLGLRWSVAIGTVWALLSLWRAAQLLSSGIRLRGLVKRTTTVPDAALQPLLEIKTKTGRLLRNAELCISQEVDRPSVFGFFRPRILIPPALMERLSREELQQVVIHEMEHLRRADDWTNLLQKIALVLFPLNPALLWVEQRLCTERELACDDSVLRSSCGRKAYALCLTHLAEYSMLRRSVVLVLGAWERQPELVRRVHRILRRPGKPMGRRQTWALTGGVLATVMLCALGLARSPQLVSFASPAQNKQAHLVMQPMDLHAVDAVSNRAAMPARAQMVSAVMSAQKPKLEAVAKPVQKHAVLRSVRRSPAQDRQAWVMMTTWTENEAGAQMVLTVAQSGEAQGDETQPASRAQENQGSQHRNVNRQARINRVSYAAVPFGYGWLIIQI